jgi:hypothetical protein
MADPSDVVKGTLMRGADGRLYFIRDDQLEKLRIPENRTDGIEDAIEKEGTDAVFFSEGQITDVWQVTGPLGTICGESWEFWL